MKEHELKLGMDCTGVQEFSFLVQLSSDTKNYAWKDMDILE